MRITEKQVFQLMRICRRYANLCAQMDWRDYHEECKNLHREIEAQQSEEIEEVGKCLD